MTDTITLPRAVVEQVREALESYRGQVNIYGDSPAADVCTILDAALAGGAEMSATGDDCRQPATEPTEIVEVIDVESRTISVFAKDQGATHPGYILGSHWLETAYSRIAAGEAEDAVLAEVLSERGWVKPPAKRERATVEQVLAEHGPLWGPSASPAFFSGWRAAERHHKIITMEDGK